MIEIGRRGLLRGLASLAAAPAIVRFESIMPVRALVLPRHPLYDSDGWQAVREDFYGRSPCMDALPSLEEIQKRLVHAMRFVDVKRGYWVEPVAMLENWPGHARS